MDEVADMEGNMVEIREFVDSVGNEVSSEIVKLSEETNKMSKGDMSKVDEIIEKLQHNMTAGAGQGLEMDV